MARRRDPGMVSFDVSSDVEIEGDDGGAPDAPEARPGWWSRAGGRWHRADRRQRRLFAGAAGGLVLVLVGGTAMAAALVSHTQTERLRSAPGGALSLEGELAEVWQAGGGGLVVLPDGGVVVAENEDVLALDVASGEERWRATLGADPVCGPQPRLDSGVEWSTPSELVTCLHGPAEERTVTVLDASGDVVGQRELPAAEYGGEDRDVAPAADGGLLVAAHDTDMPAVLDYATEDEARSAILEVEPGEATVHVEDAVTGDVRFEVPTSSSEGGRLVDQCLHTFNLSEGGWPGTFDEAEPVRVQAWPPRGLASSPTMVGYEWCDVGGATTTAGDTLVESMGEDAAFFGGNSSIGAYPDGSFVVPSVNPGDGAIGSALVGADGSVRFESSSLQVAAPAAWVDADESIFLATDTFGQTLAGLDPQGEELWRVDLENPTVLARAGDVAVVAENEDLVAVDVHDGTERWRVALNDPESQVHGWPTSAVTDGERVTVALVVYTADDTVAGQLLTVDLVTGTATRDTLGPDGAPYLTAVDGSVLLHRVATSSTDPWAQEPEVTSVSVLAPR